MKALPLSTCLLVFLASLVVVSAQAADQESCASLARQKLDKVTITFAVFMDDPQGFTLPQTPGMFGTPAGMKTTAKFCRVVGFIEPVPNSRIGFEVWLPPTKQWNNRYFGVGNPAFEGAIKYQGLKGAVEKGYATASTDTGH